MHFVAKDRSAVIRYRFETETADFLICGRCGVYVGALMKEDERYYGVANLNTLDCRPDFTYKPEPMDYSGENSSTRRIRRGSRWTPVDIEP